VLPWFYAVCTNEIRGEARRSRPTQSADEREAHGVPSGGESAEEVLLRAELEAALDGRLVDAFAHFDDEHVVLGLSVDDGRGVVCALHMFDRRGHLLAAVSGPPDSSPLLAEARGGSLARGLLAVPSADGVRLYAPDSGALREVRSFPETAPWLAGAPELHVDARGALYAVHFARIVRLSLT